MNFRSKSDVVAESIRGLIQTGEFPPGSVLRQRDLAERFRVSPTPVREALRRLEAEGYVNSELHRGATVVRTEKERLAENYLIRETLEGLATQLAAERITEEQIEQLEGINDELARYEPDDPRRLELNREFHFCIYEATGSPVLISLLNLLWRSLDTRPGHGRPLSEAVAQHRGVVEALRARDPELASQRVRDHIAGGLAMDEKDAGA